MLIPSSRDLLLAGQVQRGIMPPVPQVPGYEFFAHYQPVYPVGGDYYDFVLLPDGRLAIALGDVAGKGLPAALLMAQFAAETRHHVRLAPALGAAAADLNGKLHEYDLEEMFITLCLGVLEIALRRFTYCSAGHPLPLIRRADGRIEELGADGSGFPLGITRDAEYRHESLELGAGDIVIIFSDGVTDAVSSSGERYHSASESRLRNCLNLSCGSPKAIGKEIIRDLEEFSAGRAQFDDITLICFGPVAPAGCQPDSMENRRSENDD
jgi:serine phosphatase RsbU (regulator of sigma subunit)